MVWIPYFFVGTVLMEDGTYRTGTCFQADWLGLLYKHYKPELKIFVLFSL